MTPMRFAYADPPYIGQARKHYGPEAREVNHPLLIAHLQEFDGWALSASVRSLPTLLRICPVSVLVMAWVKPIAPPMGDNRIYSWEPVILAPLRAPRVPTRLHVVASPPQFTFRPRPPEHVIGEKPTAFATWLFEAAGLRPDDEFCDLFPGSGAIGRAWDHWRAQPMLGLSA